MSSLAHLKQYSYLSAYNIDYLEALYDNFLQDKNSVESVWRDYFESFSLSKQPDVSHTRIREQFKGQRGPCSPVGQAVSHEKQSKIDALIQAYRALGHLNADTNPLEDKQAIDPRLTWAYYGLQESDLSQSFMAQGVLETEVGSLHDIYTKLRQCYCGKLAIEYPTVADPAERDWLEHYVEHRLPQLHFNPDQQRDILKHLIAAEGLERYLDSRYVGQVRYSLEGGDSLIPLLKALTRYAAQQQVKDLVIGMAHRGRINVLLNIMGQSATELFQEFEGTQDYGLTSGDVKYHKGYSREIKTQAGPIHISLAFNPSHLEFIVPVMMGSVRARQERPKTPQQDYAIAVMLHGDASVSGEGVVMEALSMSQTRAYGIGGAIHIVLDNQIGFTTSEAQDARSSYYCTDIAKMIDAPVFHVNGDDPEAVIAAIQCAFDYRMAFHKDCFIDLVCYRRHGHQEADDPVPTQPLMYKKIKAHPTTQAYYAQQLIEQSICTAAEVEQWIDEYRALLDQGHQVVETIPADLSGRCVSNWTPYLNQEWRTVVDTAVSLPRLKQLGQRISVLPEHFHPHRQIRAIYEARRKMADEAIPMDWGFAEMMAYATLLDEGYVVRLVGQDVERGTFFHRHAVVFDQETNERYAPLQHLSEQQAEAYIYDSLLAETGPLGFEYGYSTSNPTALVIWEAQFGDFANVAQVIVDQFISSGCQKWNRLSGLVMLLPHGYEGKGPEHSSARLERYLQLCAQGNMQVFIPTTPTQIFHLLRRQVLRPYRRPLVVFSPKSLLRHKLAMTPLQTLEQGHLQLLIPEVDAHTPDQVTRIVLCSGKVYYDLLLKRREHKLDRIVLIRIEQLYPFPYEELKQELQKYKQAKLVIWCQEEPKNQGAWFCTQDRLLACLLSHQTLTYAGRPALAAPATGYPALHIRLQTQLIHEALGIKNTA